MTGQERPQDWYIKMSIVLIVFLSASVLAYFGSAEGGVLSKHPRLKVASKLPDLSGLAWIENDLFLAAHDPKNPEENDRPRVSVLQLPTSLDGILWQPLRLKWPEPQDRSRWMGRATRSWFWTLRRYASRLWTGSRWKVSLFAKRRAVKWKSSWAWTTRITAARCA